MNALVLNGSPVRSGATAWIAEETALHLQTRYSVRSVCIDDYRIGFCRGCRACERTARCVQHDGMDELMAQLTWADVLVIVSPSYWADIPGQLKAFIDRCTPWCDTHQPHASLPGGKRGYTVALRAGSGMGECRRIIETIEHFYGHMHIACSGSLGLCAVGSRDAAMVRREEIDRFCSEI